VTFTWTLPPPAAATGTPQAVTSTTATLTGSVNPDGSVVGDCNFTISPAPPGGASVPCPQQVGGGSSPVAVNATMTGLSPATTYTVTLSAASAQGSSSGSPVGFSTLSSSGPGGLTALTVTNLKLSPTRFRGGTHAATITKRKAGALPSATTISFTLSQAATVTLSFEQAHSGILAGHKCVALSKAHRKGKRCTRYAAIAHGVSRAAQAGSDRIAFDGILDGGGHLAPGSYGLSLTAIAAASRTTATQHPTFTLLG
jgi:hypothetical protein